MAAKYDGQPMDLANLRSLGVRAVFVDCACGHSASVVVDHLADDVFVPDVARRYKCSKCGARPTISRPDWRTYKPPGAGSI